MILHVPAYDPEAPVIVVNVGNSNITLATWQDNELKTPLSFSTTDESAFESAFSSHAAECSNGQPAATVVGSVVPQVSKRICEFVTDRMGKDALVVGENVPLPMDVDVDDERAIGVDRVCAAAMAYERIQSGCTVVDFGTAVTVDLVDDDGTLLGGAILPGLRMQFKALHSNTAQLPEVEPGWLETPYGRNTVEALQTGVCRGLVGAVRALVESYATSLNRWPQVVATGGDLAFLAPHCDFLDTLVTNLALRGVGLAYHKHMSAMGV